LHTVRQLLLFVLLPLLALTGLAACAPVRVLNAIASTDGGHRVDRGVAYGPLARQSLDVYTPTAAAAPPDGWPVVVFFYGGSWNSGERADYAFVGSALASNGVLTLVADYRLYPEVRYPEFLRDSALALAWGFDQAARLGGDPKRVFVMGHSAGGYIAAMLALDPRWLGPSGHAPDELAGWIGLAGAYDFLPMTNPDTQPVFFHPNYPPHTQPNYVMREMGYQVARRHAVKLRGMAAMLLFLVPLAGMLLLLIEPPHAVQWAVAAAALLSTTIGVLMERWLFFAEAEHVVMLYYRGGVA